MIVTTKKLFAHAYGKYAIGAYNINNLEQIVGLFRGNLDSQAPFIIQISKGARSYTDKIFLEGLIRAADEVYPEAIFAVHLDHGDEATCYDCIDSGFYSSVMIDASSHPFDENIAITRRVVEAAHAKGIVVEAELGMLGGVEEHVSVSESDAKLTNPEQAREFVERTLGVDRKTGGKHAVIFIHDASFPPVCRVARLVDASAEHRVQYRDLCRFFRFGHRAAPRRRAGFLLADAALADIGL